MRRIKSILPGSICGGVLCLLLAVQPGLAQDSGQTLYSTLESPTPALRGQGNPVTIANGSTNWSALATRFTVSGQAAILSGFDLALRTTLPNSVTVSIYRDALGVPGHGAALGPAVATATFVNAMHTCVPGLIAGMPDGCVPVFSATMPGNVLLTPGDYWLAVSSSCTDYSCARWYITPAGGEGVAYLGTSEMQWGTLIDAPWGMRLYGILPINVNSTDDTVEGCTDPSGKCTLRAAIIQANTRPGPDIINLAAGEIYTLDVVDNTGYFGPTGLPVITSPITINGNGATIQRDTAVGTPDFRIFLVSNAPSRLTLNQLTITGGRGAGGGLLNTGIALLTNSTVAGNGGGDGGGIWNYSGTLTVQNSTISHNTGFGGYGGGGILNFSGGQATIINSTIFENRADGPPGFQGRGDAIADAFSPAGSVVLKNTILASPATGLGSVCYAGVWASLGHNLAADNSCGLTGTGDLNSTDPLLGPLAENGGPTKTHPLLAGSPARNVIPIADCTDSGGAPLPTDQRGIGRPQGAGCDIGAFELRPGETPVGTNVVVQPIDTSTGVTPVTLTFTSVTHNGITTLTEGPTSSGPPPPPGFVVGEVYYYLETTAVFNGPISVCISYTGDPPPELLHSGDGLNWDVVTTSKDAVNHIVCGSVSSLSPFALMRRLESTPPEIGTNPTGATVNAGSNASFTASATGLPAPTVQWQVSTDNGATFNNVPAATAATLTFAAAASQNGYRYRAVFTNSVSSATTTAAILTVHTAPTISANPTDTASSPGSLVTFNAAATGNPTPTVQWQISLDNGASYSNIPDGTTTTLSFVATDNQTGYRYRAVFTNSVGSATTATATLTIKLPPTVTANPSNLTVNPGAIANFSAAATGNPTPAVQWQFSPGNGTSFSDVPGATATTLSFTADRRQTGYVYRAVFTNIGGSVTTTPAMLTVSSGPAITQNPSNITVNPGSIAGFIAAASGNPAVQWQISTDSGASFSNVPGAIAASLSVLATAAQNGYLYRAVFTNASGSATSTAALLTVNSGPAITLNPANQSVTPGSAATFQAAATGNSTVQWQVSSNGGASFSNIPGATLTTLTFTATLAQNGYWYRAVFTNGSGNATTAAALLIVSSGPAITQNPADTTVDPGTIATFSAAATGNPAVQWQVSIDNGYSFSNIPGATVTTLSFAAISEQNGYRYRAVFTNAYGTAVTTSAILQLGRGRR